MWVFKMTLRNLIHNIKTLLKVARMQWIYSDYAVEDGANVPMFGKQFWVSY